MNQKTTSVRRGTIDDTEVSFTVTAQFNGVHVCGAEGHFMEPQNAYRLFVGAHQNLVDLETNNTYNIFVADHRFSFSTYAKIDELF